MQGIQLLFLSHQFQSMNSFKASVELHVKLKRKAQQLGQFIPTPTDLNNTKQVRSLKHTAVRTVYPFSPRNSITEFPWNRIEMICITTYNWFPLHVTYSNLSIQSTPFLGLQQFTNTHCTFILLTE